MNKAFVKWDDRVIYINYIYKNLYIYYMYMYIYVCIYICVYIYIIYIVKIEYLPFLKTRKVWKM